MKKLTGIVADRKFYEESGVSVMLITALTGGTAAVFGVPSAAKGGPMIGQTVDMAIIETLDTAGGVASRSYGGGWQPATGIKLEKLEAAVVAPTTPRDPYTKPEGYVRKTASSVADDIVPAAPTAPAPVTADATA